MKKIISLCCILIVIGIIVFVGMNFYNRDNEEIISYNITKITDTKEIKNNDGMTLVNIKYSYPVIENKEESEFINDINNEYKVYSEKFINEAEEIKEEAQSLYEMFKEDFRPYTRELDFDININEGGLLSITDNTYYYSGGAHGAYIMNSRTFDLSKEKELKLEEIINNDSWNIKENTYKLFEEKLQNDGLDLTDVWGELLKEEIGDVNFYLKEGALVLYFNAEQVAPYALGAPTVEVPYAEDMFLVDIGSVKNKIVKSLTPTGFAGSSLNRIELYQNGDVYWVQYDGEGIEEENIVNNVLIASNAHDIEMFEDEGINIVGENIEIKSEVNVGWVTFNN